MEFSPIVKEVLSLPVQQLEGSGDLSVGEAVEGEVGVLGDRVRVVDSWARRSLFRCYFSREVFTVHPLGHEDRLLLTTHSLNVVAHDVVQPGKHAKALNRDKIIIWT